MGKDLNHKGAKGAKEETLRPGTRSLALDPRGFSELSYTKGVTGCSFPSNSSRTKKTCEHLQWIGSGFRWAGSCLTGVKDPARNPLREAGKYTIYSIEAKRCEPPRKDLLFCRPAAKQNSSWTSSSSMAFRY